MPLEISSQHRSDWIGVNKYISPFELSRTFDLLYDTNKSRIIDLMEYMCTCVLILDIYVISTVGR